MGKYSNIAYLLMINYLLVISVMVDANVVVVVTLVSTVTEYCMFLPSPFPNRFVLNG